MFSPSGSVRARACDRWVVKKGACSSVGQIRCLSQGGTGRRSPAVREAPDGPRPPRTWWCLRSAFGHSDRRVEVSHCHFNLRFPDDTGWGHLLKRVFAACTSSWVRRLLRPGACVLYSVVYFLLVELGLFWMTPSSGALLQGGPPGLWLDGSFSGQGPSQSRPS